MGKNQPYLCLLYSTLFAVCYYGMMQVGEITKSIHVLKAKDVHLAKNKDKLMLVLYSSKTHDEGSRPQKIKITSNKCEFIGGYSHRHFCPFDLMRRYIRARGGYKTEQEQFFIFRDTSPVTPAQARAILRLMLFRLSLDAKYYGMHSFRIRRTTDLIKINYSVDEVKLMG